MHCYFLSADEEAGAGAAAGGAAGAVPVEPESVLGFESLFESPLESLLKLVPLLSPEDLGLALP